MTESEEGAMIHGFYEFTGQEDQTWSPYKVKELLKGLIKSKFLYSVEEVVLQAILQEKGLLNLHNRHDDFFQNLAKASRTAGGKAAIEEYANSGKNADQPPELSELVTPAPGEDEEIPTDRSFGGLTTQPEEEQKIPQTVEQILRDTDILESIVDDVNSMKFYLQYSINRFWKNHNNRYTIIGEISIFPKRGTYLLTNRKLVSHTLYRISITLYIKRFEVLTKLKFINQVAII